MGKAQVFSGDCIQVMQALQDNSIDAVVTDPPYNLSDSSKRDTQCLRRIIAEFNLPDGYEGNVQSTQSGDFPVPAFSGAFLGGVNRSVRVDTRVGVPESSVDFQDAAICQHEINACDESAISPTDRDLTTVSDSQRVKSGGSYILKLADSGNTSFCDATCSCFTEPGNGLIAMIVALSGATCGNLPGNSLRRREGSDEFIRVADDAGRESEGTTGVLTGGGTEVHAMLSLDLRRGTGKLRFADRAGEGDPLFVLELAQPVGAVSGTGSFPPVLEADEVSVVCDSAGWAFTLYFPSHVFYSSGNARNAGGFMGRSWDGFESPASFQRWCTAWATECLRVLKPGGHLVAFGSTRTYHRLATGIEDAGFEIRDSLHWIQAQGFPKGLDVSKAIDGHLSRGRSDSLSIADVNAERPGEAVIRPSSQNGWRDGLVGGEATAGPREKRNTPVTDAARQWAGWNVALKPAHEPVVLARKPLAGTVAANVLTYGTGGLNIDGTRIPTADRWEASGRQSGTGSSLAGSVDGSLNVSVSSTHEGGRWPANILLTHSEDCHLVGTRQVRGCGGPKRTDNGDTSIFGIGQPGHVYGDHGMETVEAWDCAPGCPVAELDRQSGVLTSGTGAVKRASGKGYRNDVFGNESRAAGTPMIEYGDTGGASRFFPVFRYQAKAPSSQRPKEDDISHPTVKPLDLMRWLVRLVTPPDGLVLDPFAGSGTTGEACLEEGFRCVLVEREPGYLRLIRKRLDSRVPTLWD